MTRRTLIVADDLTGALDVAGPFAQRGVDTEVVVNATAEWSPDSARAQVVSVNTDSRHLSAQQAAEQVRVLVAPAMPFAGSLLKKIDSTLRGQVVAETLALMRASGRRAAIVAPAFPAQGRIMRDGVVWVHGVPLPETTFARDALSPPPAVPLARAFIQADTTVRVHNVHASQLAAAVQGAPDGETIWIADADTQPDLDDAAQALATTAGQVLWVGTAGIAQSLAALDHGIPTSERPAPRIQGRILVVVGSRAEQSQQQVAKLAARGDVALVEAPNGEVDSAALAASAAGVLVLRAVPGPQGEGQADAVAAALARATVWLLRTNPVDAIIATGGDTARAILSASGCAVLRVLGDLVPGIPYSQLSVDSRPVWLITKAGGFGTDSTFADLVDRLHGMQ